MFANDGGCMFYEGVSEFLWYIKNAKVIVTNSYHVSLFAIHFKKPFYSFVVDKMRSRFDTIEALGIEDRLVKTYIEPDMVDIDMDYEMIYKIINYQKEKSVKYFNDALGDQL